MNRVEPTSEQREAIATDLDSFSVRASAGSGKTTVLVQRYLRLVSDLGLRPDEILTITFTRKAAAEMKLRIVNELKARELWAEAQIAETGPIQTIHSLCERILHENALADGIDPEFEVLDDAATSRLIEESVRWCISTPLERYGSAERLVADLAGKQVFDATQTVHAKLWTAIRSALQQLRGSGFSPKELRDIYSSPEAVIEHWKEQLFAALPGEFAGLTVSNENGAKVLVAAMKQGGYRVPDWLKPSFPLWDEEAAVHTHGLLELTLLAWERIETQMMDRQQFDFTMLESRAVRLVQTSPETVARLRRQYRAMLVDEAQDVNPVQYRLLAALQTGAEMMVGDPQQSIYGFRLADRELFIERTTRMPSLRLSRNHRSEPGILRFVDDLFSALWKEDYQPMSEVAPTSSDDDPFGVDVVSDYTGVEIWPQDDKDTVATATAIAGLVESGCAARDIAVLTRTNMASHDVADQLRARGIATRVIGGAERFYTRLEVRDMANSLDCLAYPYAKFQMLALLRSPFVGLSLDSVALLAAEPAVIEALPGFDPPVPEDAEKIATFLTWFEPLVAIADRVPAWEVVSELMRRTAYLETIAARPNAEQTLANVRKLFSIACNDPLLDAHSFAEKIRQIQELRHRESDAPSIDEGADAVTLMTIHRAKGLEFDVVVLPDTHKKFGKWAGDILTDARTGTVMTRFKKLDTVCWKQLHRRLDETEKDEQLRVLYVGMTRAKRRLCIVTSPSPGERSAAELLTSRLALHERTWPGLVVRKPL